MKKQCNLLTKVILCLAMVVIGICIGNTANAHAACVHNYVDQYVIANPGCETMGSKMVKCSKCQDKKTASIPATGHSWSAYVTTKSATCGAKGTKTSTCSKCKKTRTLDIPATGNHNYVDQYPVTNATCTSNGGMLQKCSGCGDKKTRVIYATGHSWGSWKTEKNATCTENGYKRRYCSNSGCSSYETETIYASGSHNYEDQYAVTNATCTSNGGMLQKCSKCGDKKTRVIYATGHNWGSWKTEKNATCTENGYKRRYCSNSGCSSYETETIYASGSHNYEDQYAVTNATCTSNGGMLQKCSKCGDKKTRVIEATGHSWGNWIVDKAATRTEEGSKHKTCTVCHETQTQKINIDPNAPTPIPETNPETTCAHYSNGQRETVDSTCAKEGYTVTICAKCGTPLGVKQVIEKKPHTWKGWIIDKTPTETEYGTRHHVCSVCGTSESENMMPIKNEKDPGDKSGNGNENDESNQSGNSSGGNTGNDADEKTENNYCSHVIYGQKNTIESTCYKQGYWVYICGKCGEELGAKNMLPLIEHTYGDFVITIEPTSDPGEGYYECRKCGYRKYEVIDPIKDYKPEDTEDTKKGELDSKSENKKVCPDNKHSYSWTCYHKENCTESGLYVGTCTICGNGTSKTVSKTGHKNNGQQKEVASTCTEYGYTVSICYNCGVELGARNYKTKLAKHTGTWICDHKETCLTYGTYHKYCSGCKSIVYMKKNPTNHKPKSQQKKVKSTCIKEGYRVTVCDNCGAELGDRTYLPIGEHNYEWVTVLAPSCHSSGYDSYKCTNSGCGKVVGKRITAKLKHIPNKNKWYIIKQAGCIEPGVKIGECSLCLTKLTEEIPPVGHTAGKKCSRCGQEKVTGFTIVSGHCDEFIFDETGLLYDAGEELTLTVMADSNWKVQASDYVNITVDGKASNSSYSYEGGDYKSSIVKVRLNAMTKDQLSKEKQRSCKLVFTYQRNGKEETQSITLLQKCSYSWLSPRTAGETFSFDENGKCIDPFATIDGKVYFKLDSLGDWNVTASAKWVLVNGNEKKQKGTGDKKIYISAAKCNEAGSERKATLKVVFNSGEEYCFNIVQKLQHIHKYEFEKAENGVVKVRCGESTCEDHKWIKIGLKTYRDYYMRYNSGNGSLDAKSADDDAKAIKEYYSYCLNSTDADVISQFYISVLKDEKIDNGYTIGQAANDFNELTKFVDNLDVLTAKQWKGLSNFKKWSKVLVEENKATKALGKVLKFKGAYDKAKTLNSYLMAESDADEVKAWINITGVIVSSIPVMGPSYKSILKELADDVADILSRLRRNDVEMSAYMWVVDYEVSSSKFIVNTTSGKKDIFSVTLADLNDGKTLTSLEQVLGFDIRVSGFVQARIEYEIEVYAGTQKRGNFEQYFRTNYAIGHN
ncbi:MAG: hypothetical protein MJ131_11645 [Lachnospiraceae bacterium]|nr:hypothetical protein [Lachnospiraceae bacterium]